MEPSKIIQIIAGVISLGIGLFLVLRPKREEGAREDYLAMSGTFLVVLGFLLLVLLVLK